MTRQGVSFYNPPAAPGFVYRLFDLWSPPRAADVPPGQVVSRQQDPSMRALATFSSEREPSVLSDYLLIHGIASQLRVGKDGWVLWIRNEDQIDRAKQLLEEFQADPNHTRYGAATRDARLLRRKEEAENRAATKRIVDLRTQGPWVLPVRSTPVCWVLIVLSVFVSFQTGLGKRDASMQFWAMSSYRVDGGSVLYPIAMRDITSGQVWRLITPIFLHFGLLHLVFNMSWMLDLGRLVEARRGSWRFGLLVLIGAVISNVAQYQISGPTFGGMSGVISALFGYVWMRGRWDESLSWTLSPNTVLFFLGWLALCLTGLVGPVANAAHFVGLGVGMFLGTMAQYRPRWI